MSDHKCLAIEVRPEFGSLEENLRWEFRKIREASSLPEEELGKGMSTMTREAKSHHLGFMKYIMLTNKYITIIFNL